MKLYHGTNCDFDMNRKAEKTAVLNLFFCLTFCS